MLGTPNLYPVEFAVEFAGPDDVSGGARPPARQSWSNNVRPGLTGELHRGWALHPVVEGRCSDVLLARGAHPCRPRTPRSGSWRSAPCRPPPCRRVVSGFDLGEVPGRRRSLARLTSASTGAGSGQAHSERGLPASYNGAARGPLEPISGVQQITVGTDDADQRLDRWLRRHYPQVPQGRTSACAAKARSASTADAPSPRPAWKPARPCACRRSPRRHPGGPTEPGVSDADAAMIRAA